MSSTSEIDLEDGVENIALVDIVARNLPFDPVDVLIKMMDPRVKIEGYPDFGFYPHVGSSKGRWVGWPNMNRKGIEDKLCNYLNIIAEKVRFLMNRSQSPNDLVFSSEFKRLESRSIDTTYDQPPDLVVIPRSKVGANVEWADIESFVSLRPKRELTEYGRICFATQYDRRHVLGLGFLHNRLTLYTFDRSGVAFSREYNVHEDPDIFLRVAIGILFMDQSQLGHDVTFLNDQHLIAEGVRYKILGKIYVDRSLRGRGTVCLKAESASGGSVGKVVCVIKDAWVDRTSSTKEVQMVKFLNEKSIANIPEFLFGDIVKTTDLSGNKVNDSTEYFRGPSSTAEIRDHYRIVMTPYGEPIWQFTCLTELISATLDVIESKGFHSYYEARISLIPCVI